MKKKCGEFREDGFRFWGYKTRKGIRVEVWVSPAAFERNKETVRKHNGMKRLKAREDPSVRKQLNDSQNAWMRKNPQKLLLYHAKARAKIRGLPFDLLLEDIEIPETCPVLGIKLERGVGRVQEASPTLDRIRSEGGYVKGNVVVVSHKANTMKNTATLEELKSLVRFYEQFEF